MTCMKYIKYKLCPITFLNIVWSEKNDNNLRNDRFAIFFYSDIIFSIYEQKY